MSQGKVQGKRIRTSLVIGAAAGVLAGAWILGTAVSTTAAPVRVAALADIPSHNGLYRASMSATNGGWTVEVRTADGSRVNGAAIVLEGWMPDDSRVVPVRDTKVHARGRGEYRVAGMKLDRAGWWNVRVQIASANGTDSLAFNFVR